MDRRTLLVGSASLLAAPLAAEAQAPGKTYRIGSLSSGFPLSEAELRRSPFVGTLRELGWVEDQTVVIERRFAEGKLERLPELAAELVRLGVDVIVTTSEHGVMALKRTTGTIPIVMMGVADPVGSGFVASLARPGANITGVAWDATPEEAGKRLQLLKEVVPRLARLALLWQLEYPEVYWMSTRAAAAALRFQVRRFDIRGPGEIEGAFKAMRAWRADALVVAVPFAYRAPTLDLVAQHRVPVMYLGRAWVDAGGLMSYASSFDDLVRRAAVYVDRILRGAKPADLPVEQPTKFELVVNLKTAKALGLSIPQSILLRADEVIE